MLYIQPTLVAATFVVALTPVFTADSKTSPPSSSVSQEGVDLERAYPRLRFDRPVFLTGAGDGSGRVFVVEQAGVIRVFDGADDDVASTSVFLDISDQVSRRGNEEGLLGLAFDPEFAENGTFFVHYSSSTNDKHGTVSSFKAATPGANEASPDSETVLLEVPQPYRNHNGGMIAFGPDGHLYVSLGDGGAANDPHENGQDLSTLLGTILRIDVTAESYSVPSDNPFVDVEGARPEIWAFGLRNAWRFGFDRDTGDLWAGDVGQNETEEVSLIVRGGNYGWNTFEAEKRFSKGDLGARKHIGPVATYGRGMGISITGGTVYRGERYPALQGSYFYGDYFSGNLWRLQEGESGGYESELVRRTGRAIASFGEDDAGELFITSFDGALYRIVSSERTENTYDDWAEKLSGAGIYESTREKRLAEGVVPYEVNAPFWSDGAEKRRFLSVPSGESMTYAAEGAWGVPVGTTFVKEFLAQDGRRKRHLETRLTRRTEDGWEAATYIWDRRGRDATLAVGGQQFEIYAGRAGVLSWHGPSASECASCHVEATGFPLGIRTAQLNSGEGEDGQLQSLARLGLVTLPDGFDPASAPSLVDPHDESASLDDRARAWLDVNCAMCHQPGGPGNATIDLRSSTALADTNILDVAPEQGSFDVEDARIVAPGAPKRSVLLHRITTLGDGRMPNIGSNAVDQKGVDLIERWIESLKVD